MFSDNFSSMYTSSGQNTLKIECIRESSNLQL